MRNPRPNTPDVNLPGGGKQITVEQVGDGLVYPLGVTA